MHPSLVLCSGEKVMQSRVLDGNPPDTLRAFFMRIQYDLLEYRRLVRSVRCRYGVPSLTSRTTVLHHECVDAARSHVEVGFVRNAEKENSDVFTFGLELLMYPVSPNNSRALCVG